MWTIIPSLTPLLQGLAVAFTEPSFRTHTQIVLGWLMCVGHGPSIASSGPSRPALSSRGPSITPSIASTTSSVAVPGPSSRWPIRCVSWSSSASAPKASCIWWSTIRCFTSADQGLRTGLVPRRGRLDGQAGRHRLGEQLGGPRPGHPHPPGTRPDHLPGVTGGLHLPGKDAPSCVALAKEMLGEILAQFPDRRVVLIGDGAYAVQGLLGDLDPRADYVGRMRGDAEVYTRSPPRRCRESAARSRRRARGCPGPARRRGWPIKGKVRDRGTRSR